MKRFISLVLAMCLVCAVAQPALAADYDERWSNASDWKGDTPHNDSVQINNGLSLYMVPNSHIDTGWMWPYQYTVETLIRDTYPRAINALKSNSEYKFSASAAVHYEWVKEYLPEYWDDLKTLVDNGQWDITGGQIVEPDLNLTGGESLVRQSLYGQHFFEREFGADKVPTLAYVPDTFGFSGQFPQIIKKSGMDYFLTSKLTWNDVNAAGPTDIFWWKGIDGDERNDVLSYTLVGGYNSEITVAGRDWTLRRTFGRNTLAPSGSSQSVSRGLILYGTGDMGGGPVLSGSGDTNDRAGNRYSDPWTIDSGTPVNVKMASATEYFEDVYAEMEGYRDNPRFQREGEMYLEFHRGTYTSWSRMKKYNRQNEILAETAEKAATLSYWVGGVPNSSSDKIEQAWKNMLVAQFHDVLPGTSSPNTYLQTFNKHELARNLLTNVRDNALLGMAYRADTDVEGIPVFVYNPLSWARDGEVTVDLQFDGELPAYVTIKDGLVELLSKEISRDDERKTITVSFMTKDVPAMGYKVFEAIGENSAPPPAAATDLELVNLYTMQNKYFILELNPQTGYIKSLRDRINGYREIFSQDDVTEANGLHVYSDNGADPVYSSIAVYEAWDLIPMQINKEPEIFFDDGAEIVVYEKTPEKITFRVKKTWKDSTVYQYISMYSDVDRVDVHMEMDWTEKNHLLKVSFPVLVDASKASYEIAYGAIERSTTRDTDYDRARFEHSGHKWMDVTADDGSYGVSIANDAKYGYDVLKRGNGTTDKRVNGVGGVGGVGGADIPTYVRSRITVVRSPLGAPVVGSGAPPDFIDIGYQEFNYSICPHTGRWQDAKTVNKAHELCYPMQAIQAPKDGGGAGTGSSRSFSFLSADKDNVIISTVKPQNDSPDRNKLILRVYESTGTATNNVTISLPERVANAKEVNLLEHDYPVGHVYYGGKSLSINNNKITFDIGKYEILTLEVQIDPSGNPILSLPQKAVDMSSYFDVVGATTNSTRASVNGNFEGRLSLPAEHWPEKVEFQGVEFTMASNAAGNIFTKANGQEIDLSDVEGNGYNRLYLLGVSTSAGADESSGEFTVKFGDGGEVSKEIEFANWKTDLTGWDQYLKMDAKPYVYDSIAHVFTHYHNGSPNKDESTLNNYLFIYEIDIDPAKSLDSVTLPIAPGIKIAAMTVVSSPIPGFAEVYDPSNQDKLKPPAKVTGVTAAITPDGKDIDVSWQPSTDGDIMSYVVYYGTTENFALEDNRVGIISGMRNTASFSPDDNVPYYFKVTAVNRSGLTSEASDSSTAITPNLMNFCLPGRRVTLSATGSVGSWEPPEAACDGIFTTKWCMTGITLSNPAILTVQLVSNTAAPRRIDRFKLVHAGVAETKGNNAKDYDIEYSLDGTSWALAVAVRDNEDTMPIHDLSVPIGARYVRLNVLKGTQGAENTARIHQFMALGFDMGDVSLDVVTGVNARVIEGDPFVTVGWNKPDNNQFLDPDYYEVYYGTTENFLISEGNIAGSVNAPETELSYLPNESGVYYFKVLAMNTWGRQSEPSLSSNSVTVELTNLCLPGKRVDVTATGFTASHEEPPFAVDGVLDSKWCMTGITATNPAYLTVQLVDNAETPVQVARFAIRHAGSDGSSPLDPPNSATKDYDIEYSLDGLAWVKVVEVRGNTAVITKHDMPTRVLARYVRLNVISGAQLENVARIYEFMAFGFNGEDTFDEGSDVVGAPTFAVDGTETAISNLSEAAGKSLKTTISYTRGQFKTEALDVALYVVLYDTSGSSYLVVDAVRSALVKVLPGETRELEVEINVPLDTGNMECNLLTWSSDLLPSADVIVLD